MQEKVTGHEMSGGGGRRTESEGLALEIGKRMDGFIRGDELAREARVFLALDDGNSAGVGAKLGLHVGKAPQPGHIDLACGERLDDGSVIGDRNELHFHPDLALEVPTERRELALQLRRSFVRNGRNFERALSRCQVRR